MAISLVVGVGMVLLSETSVEAGSSCGKASWYALNSKTASGGQMNPSAMTAAHRSYGFGSTMQVIRMFAFSALVRDTIFATILRVLQFEPFKRCKTMSKNEWRISVKSPFLTFSWLFREFTLGLIGHLPACNRVVGSEHSKEL
jgi:hypothetical protein